MKPRLKQRPLMMGLAHHRGFTLIELMVTMVIISILVGMAVMSIRTDNKDRLLEEAERFNGLFDLAKDEALFQSTSIGIGFSQSGYAFFRQADPEADEELSERESLWERLSDDQLEAHQYFQGAISDIVIENQSIELPEAVVQPDIMIAPDGEITPFEFHITYPNEESVKLNYNMLGRLIIEKKPDDDELTISEQEKEQGLTE